MPWFESLPNDLPDGRLVVPAGGKVPAYWISSRPTSAPVWSAWRERHPETGLWPVLIRDKDGADDPLELHIEETANFSSPHAADADAAEVLAEWFRYIVEDHDEFDYLEPFGPTWPGVSPPLPPLGPPDQLADRFAAQLIAEPPLGGGLHLGLVAAAVGFDVLTTLGWIGPFNHENDTGLIAQVLLDWRQRFDARLVGLGSDTMDVSVAAPPTTHEQALRVAMEHVAFSPDNIWQGTFNTIPDYAEAIIDMPGWSFWWD